MLLIVKHMDKRKIKRKKDQIENLRFLGWKQQRLEYCIGNLVIEGNWKTKIEMVYFHRQ